MKLCYGRRAFIAGNPALIQLGPVLPTQSNNVAFYWMIRDIVASIFRSRDVAFCAYSKGGHLLGHSVK